MQATWSDWAAFAGAVLGAMGLDRALFGRAGHTLSFREALVRSGFWLCLGIGFGGYTWFRWGSDYALTYLVAYLVEESLSVDNLFVFLVVFNHFGLSEARQQRVLFWGVFGAVVMRALFIGLGTALIHRFHWMTYVFGGFLLWTGIKLLFRKEETYSPEKSLALKFARRFLRVTSEFDGNHFFVVREGVRYATPLFLVLIVIEFTDLLFAVDSVPAVLAISNDVFIVYTSNILAVLGLRALYFVLSGMMGQFAYLGVGLAVILILIGAKMLLASVISVSSSVSLAAVGGVLGASIGLSWLFPPKPRGPGS